VREAIAVGSIDFSYRDHVATVVLNNPAKRNAVDAEMRAGLAEAYREIEQNPEIRVAIITGAGERAFCAGGDIQGYLQAEAIGPGRSGPPPIPKPWPASKPFVAAIRGYAVGGGFPLALACDLRVVGRGACIGPSGLRLGVAQGAQQSQRLVRLIGASRALGMLLLSQYVSGEEAAAMGLAHAVVDDDEVLPTARNWAETIASYDPWAVMTTKRLVYEGQHRELGEALAWEAQLASEGYLRPQALDSFTAFTDSRDEPTT
jgi:enoyl-CoA hydratase/carnithine racemase